MVNSIFTYIHLISPNNSLYISLREVYVYQFVPDFLCFMALFCSIEFSLYSLEIDNGLSLILVHSQLSNFVFFSIFLKWFLFPTKEFWPKPLPWIRNPRKLLATDLPHRVEELQHVLHGVASAAPRRLKFSMELKGAPGMLKGNRGEVVCAFF